MANVRKLIEEAMPFDDLSFEEQTYAYARRWALSRRRFLQASGAFVAAAGLMTGPGLRALAQTRGGHLKVGRASGSSTMDPHKAGQVSDSEIQAHIYDPLAVIDPRTGVIHPSLALEWEFTNGNKTVVFKLRPNVEFHDGTPFNAQAVKFSADRYRDPAIASPTSFLLGPLDTVEVMDDLTVAYNYKQPYVALWVGFLIPYASPISPTAVEKHDDAFGRNPVGTGPFKFAGWDANDIIRLERNEARDWASPAYENDGGPYLDSAEFRTIPEAQTRVASLLSSEIDLIAGSSAVPLESLSQLTATPGIEVYTQPALGAHGIVFAQSRPNMDNPTIRKAISHALQREKVLAFALDGNGKISTSPLASSYAQHDPATAEYGYNYDPEAAKALLAEAGVADGLKLTLLTNDDEIGRAIGEVLQSDLAAVGVELEVTALPNAEYGAIRNQGRYDLSYMSYSYSDADIVNFLFANGSGLNLMNIETDELNELVNAQRVEFDPEKRKEQLYRIQRITVGDAYYLPIIEANIAAAMRDNVHINTTAAGTLVLNDVYFES